MTTEQTIEEKLKEIDRKLKEAFANDKTHTEMLSENQ